MNREVWKSRCIVDLLSLLSVLVFVAFVKEIKEFIGKFSKLK